MVGLSDRVGELPLKPKRSDGREFANWREWKEGLKLGRKPVIRWMWEKHPTGR